MLYYYSRLKALAAINKDNSAGAQFVYGKKATKFRRGAI